VRSRLTSDTNNNNVLNNIDEVIVELGLVLIELVVIFIKAAVDVWNDLLKSFWNRTFFKFASAPVFQIPKHQCEPLRGAVRIFFIFMCWV
jgi:hypothetical protein